MSDGADRVELPPVQGPNDDRLDSWKEIAAFLRRDVRTVQRWEKQAGLPVHRHADTRLRTAYAYRSELDAWWRTQRTLHAEALPAEVPTPPDRSWREARLRATAIAGAGLLASITITALVIGIGGSAENNQPSADSPLTVLVARFDDQAGDPGLADLLEEHVGRELELHAGLETASPARTARALRLMRREPSLRVTAAIGREAAHRDGRVTLVITGRVHRLDSRFLVDIAAVEPADGRVRLSHEWQGATRGQVVSRVKSASRHFAERLVNERPARSSPTQPPLEQVTTASLPALRLYTAAVDAGRRRQWAASELLARRAFGVDERFAAAYAWAAWSMRQAGRPASECMPLLERAVALATDVTDRENYFISGTYHTTSGDMPKAVAAFEALHRLLPPNREALDQLIDAYTRSGRMKEAVELSLLRAERHPDDFYANVRAAHALAVTQRDAPRALPFVTRAQRLSMPAADDRPFWSAWLAVLPVFQHWLDGAPPAALETLAPVERSLGERLGRERDAYATAVGFAHLAFGRAERAERAFRYAATPTRQLNLATLALIADDKQGARRWLSQIPEHSGVRPALFARVGLTREAERGLETSPITERSDGVAAVTRGLLAARSGQVDEATAALRRGLELLRFSGEPEYFFAVEALARIAVAHGEIDRGIKLVSEAVAERAHTYSPSQWTAAYWIRLNMQLARMYQRQGRHEDAERVSASVRNLLVTGDAVEPTSGVSSIDRR